MTLLLGKIKENNSYVEKKLREEEDEYLMNIIEGDYVTDNIAKAKKIFTLLKKEYQPNEKETESESMKYQKFHNEYHSKLINNNKQSQEFTQLLHSQQSPKEGVKPHNYQ